MVDHVTVRHCSVIITVFERLMKAFRLAVTFLVNSCDYKDLLLLIKNYCSFTVAEVEFIKIGNITDITIALLLVLPHAEFLTLAASAILVMTS